jgi:hypothetical protein
VQRHADGGLCPRDAGARERAFHVRIPQHGPAGAYACGFASGRAASRFVSRPARRVRRAGRGRGARGPIPPARSRE